MLGGNCKRPESTNGSSALRWASHSQSKDPANTIAKATDGCVFLAAAELFLVVTAMMKLWIMCMNGLIVCSADIAALSSHSAMTSVRIAEQRPRAPEAPFGTTAKGAGTGRRWRRMIATNSKALAKPPVGRKLPSEFSLESSGPGGSFL